jgi:hypothetical protein
MNSSQIQGGADMKAMNARVLISCLALAAMVILAAPAQAATGGVAFQASSLPVQVRGEGLTETIGAVVLQATAGGTIVSGSSITVVYSGAITNSSSFSGQAGLSCVINTVTCAPVPTSITISASGSQATISFGASVGFTQGDYIELSQVRMNISALGTAASTVTATLSGTSGNPSTNPITFTQSQVGVASIVNPSVKAKVSTTANSIQTCSIPTGGGSAANQFAVTVSEQYPAAFTSYTDETAFSSLGSVSNGSLINVTINNLPTGFGIQFASQNVQTGPGVLFTQVSPTPTSPASPTISTGSAITYTFQITNDSTSAIDGTILYFNVGYTKTSSSGVISLTGSSATALGTVVNATATVSLGPSAGIVSFATNNEGSGTIVTLGDCVTNLLFPFTTNQVGFDTSVQISNTSADKLAFPSGGASAQSGTCTLTYYPTDLTTQTASAAGNAGTPTQFTTPTIPAGGNYTFAQSASLFKGQSGYMFAVCRFLDAHAFSYVFNGTQATATISQGLLALVIPNNSIAGNRLANPAAQSTCTPTCTGTSCTVATNASCSVTQIQGVTFAPGNYEGIAH